MGHVMFFLAIDKTIHIPQIEVKEQPPQRHPVLAAYQRLYIIQSACLFKQTGHSQLKTHCSKRIWDQVCFSSSYKSGRGGGRTAIINWKGETGADIV